MCIRDRLTQRLEKNLAAQDMGIELSDAAKNLLAARGFDPVLGARPLRRTLQREIEDVLSEKILFGEIGAGEIIEVDVTNWDGKTDSPRDYEKAEFTFSPKPKPLPEETFGDLDEDDVRDIAPEDGQEDVQIRATTPPESTDPENGPDASGSDSVVDADADADADADTGGAAGTDTLEPPRGDESDGDDGEKA